jgi:hypothetical protein
MFQRLPRFGATQKGGVDVGVFIEFVLPKFDRQTHLLTSRAIARKLITDHDTWRIAQAPQKPLEETGGGFRFALALDKDVEDIAILIDSPKIMRLAANFDEDLVSAKRSSISRKLNVKRW